MKTIVNNIIIELRGTKNQLQEAGTPSRFISALNYQISLLDNLNWPESNKYALTEAVNKINKKYMDALELLEIETESCFYEKAIDELRKEMNLDGDDDIVYYNFECDDRDESLYTEFAFLGYELYILTEKVKELDND